MTDHWIDRLIRRKTARHLLFISAFLVVMFISIWIRVFIGSMKDFSKGENFFIEKQYVKAITYFDRSMHWYAPFNPYVEKSAEYLWKISERAERINDYTLSRIALESIKDSFYGTRSFYNPGTIWINKCEKKISDIVRNLDKNKLKKGGANSKEYAVHVTKTKYNDPKIFWTLILEIGLFGWIGAIIGFIYFCLGKETKPDAILCNYRVWMLIACIGYGLWILGMIKA